MFATKQKKERFRKGVKGNRKGLINYGRDCKAVKKIYLQTKGTIVRHDMIT